MITISDRNKEIGFLLVSIIYLLTNSFQVAQGQVVDSETEIVLASEVSWKKLNPKRGNKSPQAGTLWGDRNGAGATGFLVKFVDGFSSPPHIHNVTYRGVVISGLVHNDDPEASLLWMPPGSYWSQPAGESHITSSKGSSIAYIEIDSGPYLVLPASNAFDKGERPMNVDRSNILWLSDSDTNWIESGTDSFMDGVPKLTFLWRPGGGNVISALIKFPNGFEGKIRTASSLRAVLVDGELGLLTSAGSKGKKLTPGSYFHSKLGAEHKVSCREAKADCLLYVRSKGKFTVAP